MNKAKNKRKVLFFASIFALIIASGFIGYLFGNKNLEVSTNYVPKLVKTELGKPNDVNFSIFWEAYQKLVSNYVGTIDAKKFLYGAIEGGFASTDDPYTNFMSPDITSEFENELTGELEGIGVKIGILDNIPAVIAPLPGSPAEKAGLKAKDKIIKVDDSDTSNLTIDEVVDKIRGKEGTTVKLTVERDGENKTFEIQREKISVETVTVSYDGDVAILEISEFGTDTQEEFLKAVTEIKQKNISKVVLDLRNNPGGLLDGAVDVASQFFAKDTLVVTEEGKSYKEDLKTTGDPVLENVKLVVLVNGGSASAAEILAGAVQDHGRGEIIGEKTFGKGTVQQYENLSDGSSVKITIAKWLTPKGTSIDKNGITPDIEVSEPDNILFEENDPVINRAMQELSK